MFSAINSEKFLSHWSPEALKKSIDNERTLTRNFRSAHETSLMYKLLTVQGITTRLYNKKSTIENIAEVILRTECTKMQAINIIKANLDMLPELRTREVVNLMLHIVIDPKAFENATYGDRKYRGKSLSSENKLKMPEYREDEFEKYFNVRNPAPVLRIYDLLPAQKEAISLYCTVFAKPEAINVLFCNLLQTFSAKIQANNCSPLALAAFIHNGIIAIHPYEDGNGRIARFMMNKVFALYGLKHLDPKDQTQPGYVSAERRYDMAVASEDDNVLVAWMAAEHRALRAPAPRVYPVMSQHPLLRNQPICLETENVAKKIIAFAIWKQAVKQDTTFQDTPLGEFIQNNGY